MWWAMSALASPLYPGTLTSELELSCTPPCTVCHETAVGGTGTATKPFAVSLQDAGLTGGSDTESLHTALAEADPADLESLQSGLDPNDGTEFCAVITPTYGCFSHVQTAWSWGLGVCALVLVRVRSRA
jgi:hypothetical protein